MEAGNTPTFAVAKGEEIHVRTNVRMASSLCILTPIVKEY